MDSSPRYYVAAKELAEAREACAQALALEPANEEAMALRASIDAPVESMPQKHHPTPARPSSAAAPMHTPPSAAATAGAPAVVSGGASPVVLPPLNDQQPRRERQFRPVPRVVSSRGRASSPRSSGW